MEGHLDAALGGQALHVGQQPFVWATFAHGEELHLQPGQFLHGQVGGRQGLKSLAQV